MVVSKSDLLPYVPFSIDAVTKDAREINPDLDVISISTLNGEGLDQWCNWLQEKVKQKNTQ
jgi:hydrogenase nickel incorporation protein HypB